MSLHDGIDGLFFLPLDRFGMLDFNHS